MNNEELLTYATVDYSSLSPMMRQYFDMKKIAGDAILMFRLGDFYEMFFDDAISVSRILELTLTSRDCGLEKRAPMCGVPHHSASSYMQRLVTQGYKVAICEQMEDPALAKGLVKRSITRVLTPGTVTDTSGLDEKKNNYLVCVFKIGMQYGVAAADITTGIMEATQLVTGNTAQHLINLLSKYRASELIYNEDFSKDPLFSYVSDNLVASVTLRPNADFSCGLSDRVLPPEYKKETGKNGKSKKTTFAEETKNILLISAIDAILSYLDETQQAKVSHFSEARVFEISDTMELDVATRTNLEITSTIRSKSKKGSLLWAIDMTMTSMGGRLLRQYIEEPLIDITSIHARLDAVEQAKNDFIHRQELREALTGVYDIERLASRISLSNVNARDLLCLRNTLAKLPYIYECASHFNKGILKDALKDQDDLSDIYELLDKSLAEDPPISIKEGGIIKEGYNEEADHLRNISTNGKSIILDMEAREKEATGIKNLKISYNKVFGYYIEVSKGNIPLVPSHYIRKQTLTTGERYITEEMKEIENEIVGSTAKLINLEYDLFCEVREKISASVHRLFKVASLISLWDVITSLGELADRNNYCRPEVDDSTELVIEEGRHPVVEKMLKEGEFVPNGISMNDSTKRIMILTGPNMAGKSTYMRQNALIVLLAQIGSFVPATTAHIGVVDRIFTRIGASDDISLGQSTFMVEMNEVAGILRNGTYRSLLLLDEVGRGTSTYDGLAIAWAIIEFISNRSIMFARTIFATHYHELNQLEKTIDGVYNAHVNVEEENKEIRFLHKISLGGTSDSYGIEVARLAGVPSDVVSRANLILSELEKTKKLNISFESDGNEESSFSNPISGQIPLFAPENSSASGSDSLRAELAGMDISRITPLEAMNILFSLIEKAKGDA
ncbi:MAG: DNA mismatch repair protein MutS [Clostridiales bacterium]|nr:DNA mismatch repair protein MutS [Clostridiales bacterium]